jgi:hypothetical protein
MKDLIQAKTAIHDIDVGEYEAQLDNRKLHWRDNQLPNVVRDGRDVRKSAVSRGPGTLRPLLHANCHRTEEAGAGPAGSDETIQCHKSRLVGETVMCSSYTQAPASWPLAALKIFPRAKFLCF